MTVYGYARVSAAGQDHARQVEALTAAGCDPIVTEKASAAAGRKRPGLVRLVAKLQAGDVLVFTNLDRFARSARDALNLVAEVTAKGAEFRSLAQPWADTTTPAGRLMVTLFAGLAEFDREMILARTADGRRFARARGVKLGRKPTLTAAQVRFVQKARAEVPPMPLGQLVRVLGVSRSTICRAARGPAPEAEAPPRQVDLEEVLRKRG